MPPKKRKQHARASKGKAKKKREEEEESEEEEIEEEEEEKLPTSSRSKRKTQSDEKVDEKQWKEHYTLLYAPYPDLPPATKVIGFDMDSTLVEPNGKGKFPKGRTDWHWWHESVPTTLKTLNAEGYRVIIFSNQNGIGTGKQRKSDITGKILDLSSELGFPLQAFIATNDDEYRKPLPAMWEFFVTKVNGGVVPDKSSMYIGDAAGRPAEWKSGRKKDFSCSDRKFAANAGLTFKTPEEYFLKEAAHPTWNWDAFDTTVAFPTEVFSGGSPLASEKQEIILLVGFPGSGKSTFAKTHLLPKGYAHINRDTLKTAGACMNAAKSSLKDGKSVVVDNTNPSREARADYVNIAKDFGIPIRCYHMETSIELAKHLNMVRELLTDGDSKHVPKIGYNMFKKNFKEPSLDEGFSEIKKINFVPSFKNEAHERFFKLWT